MIQAISDWFPSSMRHKPQRLKWFIASNDGGVWGDDPSGLADTLVLRSTEQTIDGKWQIEDPAYRTLTLNEKSKAILKEGDLLVTKSSGSALHIGKTTLVDSETAKLNACFSNFMQRIRVMPSVVIPRYAYWLFNSFLGREQLNYLSNTTTGLANLNGNVLSDMVFLLRSLRDQIALANLLDKETSRIDALISRKERQIELLLEKRQAIITRAVTKGLNPNTKMKDSGIQSFGKMPFHWQLKRLRYVARELGVGVVVNPSQYVSDEGLPFLYGSDISEGYINTEECRRISDLDSRRLLKSRLRTGDLVMVRVGAPGVTAVVPQELDGANCASMLLIRKGRGVDSDWLCYALNSRCVRAQVEAVQYGAAQEQFNVSHAVNFVLPVPPQEEQREIASFLNQRASQIDATKAKVHDSLLLLKEYRSSLITAAVSGQIDVTKLSNGAKAHASL